MQVNPQCTISYGKNKFKSTNYGVIFSLNFWTTNKSSLLDPIVDHHNQSSSKDPHEITTALNILN